MQNRPAAHGGRRKPEASQEAFLLFQETTAAEAESSSAEATDAPADAGGVSLSISQGPNSYNDLSQQKERDALLKTVFVRVPDVDGLITQALLTGDFEGAVELCLHDNRMADSIILAIAGGDNLLEKTQKMYFAKSRSKITKVTSTRRRLSVRT